MKLCVLLILLTAISTAHTGPTYGPILRKVFGIANSKQAEAKFQRGGRMNQMMRWFLGINKETEPRLEASASHAFTSLPLPTINTDQLSPHEKYYKQPHLMSADKKEYYADATFIAPTKSILDNPDLILVSIEPQNIINRELYFPAEDVNYAIDSGKVKVSRLIISRSRMVTKFSFPSNTLPSSISPFAYKILKNVKDIPKNGFMLSGGKLYPCTIDKKEEELVEITFEEEQPPIGSIKSGTPIVGNTLSNPEAATLIAICKDNENLSKPKPMAVVITASGIKV